MTDRTLEAPWLASLLDGLHHTQVTLLQWLHRLGWVPTIDGQPAWPWAWQLSGDNLLIDLGQARSLALSLCVLGLAMVCVLVAVWWRAGRIPLLAVAIAGVVLAPWPPAAVLWQAAFPTSFHVPTVPFSDVAIARGGAVYAQQCVACHGAAGNGQGPLAARQAVWPPNFTGPLLWRRSDGDLFWAIQHGVRTPSGELTMAGFGDTLSATQAWEVLHYLRALGAGELLKASGNWAQPIHLPDMQLRCNDERKTRLADWPGQRLRLATTGPETLVPDPRLITVWLPPVDGDQPAVPPAADCVVQSTEAARAALQLVNGGADISATQLLTDRGGWLRARNGRGAQAWSDDDVLCRAEDGPQGLELSSTAGAPRAEDGLSRVIRIMDASPVRFVKAGRVH